MGELSEERPGLVANPGMSFALCRLRRGVEGRASDDDDDRDGVAVDLGTEAPSPLLTPAQIRKIRCAEMMLAAGQCTAGTAVAALTAMGAAEMLLW